MAASTGAPRPAHRGGPSDGRSPGSRLGASIRLPGPSSAQWLTSDRGSPPTVAGAAPEWGRNPYRLPFQVPKDTVGNGDIMGAFERQATPIRGCSASARDCREQIAGSFEVPCQCQCGLARPLSLRGLRGRAMLPSKVVAEHWACPFRPISAYSETVEGLDPCRQRRAPARGRARAARAAGRHLREAGLPPDDRGGRRRPQPGLDPAAREPRLQGRGPSPRCGSETVRRGGCCPAAAVALCSSPAAGADVAPST